MRRATLVPAAHIFRQYDIRGLVDRELTPEVFESIGRAFGSSLAQAEPGRKRKTVTLGRDVRLSSEPLCAGFARGVAAAGLDVIDVGMVPTPVLYFSIFHWDSAGGAMITGSHNPVAYNGVKLCEGRWPLYGEKVQGLLSRIREGRYSTGSGGLERRNVLPAYTAELKRRFPAPLGARVAVDAGNGCAGPLAPGVLRDLGCRVEELYCEPDGSFPHHLPDPEVPANMKDLIRLVRDSKADAGLGFDGDADRVGLVDETGTQIQSDRLLLLLARHYLSRFPGGKVVYDVKCSEILETEIRAAGGVPIMWKTGHSLIKKKMREEEALLAGELSGHICVYRDYYGFDDALFAALMALEIRRQSGRSLSSLFGDFPRTYSTHEIKVGCPEEEKVRVIDQVLSRARAQGGRVNDIDGLRLTTEDGWMLVRASNTTPILTVRFESRSREGLERVARRTAELLQGFPFLETSGIEKALEETRARE